MPDAADQLAEFKQPVTAANAACAASRLLEFDPQTFRDCFDREPFTLRHHLLGNSLFTLERLTALARFIEARPNQVYADAGVADLNQRWDQSQHPSASLAETVEKIAGNDTWIILRPLELDPAYQLVLNQCLSELRYGIGDDWGRPIWRENAIVFLTSSRRVSTHISIANAISSCNYRAKRRFTSSIARIAKYCPNQNSNATGQWTRTRHATSRSIRSARAPFACGPATACTFRSIARIGCRTTI
jgi:hypothetical protein